MSDGIWIGRPVDNEAAALATVEELWAGLSNPGNGGRSAGPPDGEVFHAFPDRLFARLQQLSEALASELRFKAVEIFISSNSHGDWRRAAPFFASGAYRQSDKTYGAATRAEKDGRGRGVYAFSNSLLKPLHELIVYGECHSAWTDRLDRFVAGAQDPDIAYVNYKINGTIIALLAGNIPYAKRGPGAVLWDRAKPFFGLRDLGKDTRAALSCLIDANGGALLLEAGDDPARAVEGVERVIASRAGAKRLAIKNPEAVQAAVPDAIAVWRKVSDDGDAFCQSLRARVQDLPGEVPQFLFEARPHTYLTWLQSATLEVAKSGEFVRHPDLPGRIAAARGRRNQPIDVIAKAAYEDAARSILGEAGLRSMLLVPFAASTAPERGIHGFVRLMNRFAHGRDHAYEKNDVAEMHLANALTKVLSRVLADDTLLGFASATGNGRPPLIAGESEK